MKFYSPVKILKINQFFGQNKNTYYAEKGNKGHSGLDLACSYGQEIASVCDGEVISVRNKNNPDLMQYRAVYVLTEDAGVSYEVSYGHAKDILVKIGDKVKTGQVLMTGGNTGDVARAGKKITKAEKDAGSIAGTHLHFGLRILKKVLKKEKGKKYFTNDKGIFKKGGYYYEMTDTNNGYSGCIDPLPFFGVITQTLKYGMRGDEVRLLQEKLKITVDGIFGKGTEAAVKSFQKKNKLKVDGIVGKQTRSFL